MGNSKAKKVPQSFDEWWEQIGKLVCTEDEKPACRAAWGGCTNASLAARGVYL